METGVSPAPKPSPPGCWSPLRRGSVFPQAGPLPFVFLALAREFFSRFEGEQILHGVLAPLSERGALCAKTMGAAIAQPIKRRAGSRDIQNANALSGIGYFSGESAGFIGSPIGMGAGCGGSLGSGGKGGNCPGSCVGKGFVGGSCSLPISELSSWRL